MFHMEFLYFSCFRCHLEVQQEEHSTVRPNLLLLRSGSVYICKYKTELQICFQCFYLQCNSTIKLTYVQLCISCFSGLYWVHLVIHIKPMFMGILLSHYHYSREIERYVKTRYSFLSTLFCSRSHKPSLFVCAMLWYLFLSVMHGSKILVACTAVNFWRLEKLYIYYHNNSRITLLVTYWRILFLLIRILYKTMTEDGQ